VNFHQPTEEKTARDSAPFYFAQLFGKRALDRALDLAVFGQ